MLLTNGWLQKISIRVGFLHHGYLCQCFWQVEIVIHVIFMNNDRSILSLPIRITSSLLPAKIVTLKMSHFKLNDGVNHWTKYVSFISVSEYQFGLRIFSSSLINQPSMIY